MNLPIMEISDIAIDQSNSNVIYLATGDRDSRNYGYYGNSQVRSRLFKTTDGGSNWFQINADLGTGTYIENLWVHPKRPSEIVVIKTNGVYKSLDSGSSWQQVTKTSLVAPYDAGNDVIFQGAAYAELANPERLYSCYLKRYNANWYAYQLQRSDDFGASWQLMDSVTSVVNAPDFATNYIKLRVAPSDANCLYIAATEYDFDYNADRFGAVTRTLDGGKTWETRSRYPSVPNIMGWVLGDTFDIGSQSSYTFVLAVDPKDKNKISIDGVDAWGSMDGGRTFNKSSFWLNSLGESTHADHHWGEYQPVSGTYFLATDGGLFKTNNLTPGNNASIENCVSDTALNIFSQNCYTFPTKWDYASNGVSNNEFYAIAVSKSNPNIIIAGAQDNGTMMHRDGIWFAVHWGDGMVPLIHPTNPNIFYVTTPNGSTSKTIDGGKNYEDVSFPMDTADGGNWVTPMEMLESNPNIIFQGRESNIWKTTNAGNTWQRISNFNNPKYFHRTSAMALSQSNANVLYVARRTRESSTVATQYFLYKTTDGGTTWSNMWSTAFPNAWLTDIAVHPTQPNKVWITFNVGYNTANTNQPKKVFYSADAGLTWTNISAGLPPFPALTVVAQENSPVDAVYVGTTVGVFYRDNTMSQFVEFQVGMPRGVMITDLKLHTGVGKIYAGTYGRGIWAANLRDQPYDPTLSSARVNRGLLLDVYPNPTKGSFIVDWTEKLEENQSLNVVDIMGKVIYSTPQYLGKMTIDLSNQPEGMYYLQFKTGAETLTKKIVVQH